MPKFRCKERLIKMPLPIQLVTPKDITQTKKKYKSRRKKSKCSSSKSNPNRDYRNPVETNTWTPLLRDIDSLLSALPNQRRHYEANLT